MATAKKDPEVEAMAKLIDALDGLEPELQARAIRWAAERYGVMLTGKKPNLGSGDGDGGGTSPDAGEFEDLGDLLDAAAPETNEDRALVIAYWLQELTEDKQPTFTGQQVNKELKNLGHGTDDITALIGKLMATSPQQIRQTKKSGSSRQARKSYKVTKAGIKRVQELIDAS